MGMVWLFSIIGGLFGLFLLKVAFNRFLDGFSIINLLVGIPALGFGGLLVYFGLSFYLQISNPKLHSKIQTFFDEKSPTLDIDKPKVTFEFAKAPQNCQLIKKQIEIAGINTVNKSDEHRHSEDHERLSQIQCQGEPVFSLVTAFTKQSRYWFGKPDNNSDTLQDLDFINTTEYQTIKANLQPVDKNIFLISTGDIYPDALILVKNQQLSRLEINNKQQNFNQIHNHHTGSYDAFLNFGLEKDSFLIMYNLGHTSYQSSHRYTIFSIVSEKYPKGLDILKISIKEGEVIAYARQDKQLYIKLKRVLDQGKVTYKQFDLSAYL